MYLHDLCWMLSVVLVLFLVFFRIRLWYPVPL